MEGRGNVFAVGRTRLVDRGTVEQCRIRPADNASHSGASTETALRKIPLGGHALSVRGQRKFSRENALLNARRRDAQMRIDFSLRNRRRLATAHCVSGRSLK